MPDNREYQNNADSISSNVSAENQSLDEGMRRLKLEDSIEEVDTCSNPYPCRPGEPDCIYFLRTGSCGYGRNCRYNHPNYAAQATREKGELPERGGQPDCQEKGEEEGGNRSYQDALMILMFSSSSFK
ncbi:hypothetical protein HPP92_002642, partial [Vanilla planifolia]